MVFFYSLFAFCTVDGDGFVFLDSIWGWFWGPVGYWRRVHIIGRHGSPGPPAASARRGASTNAVPAWEGGGEDFGISAGYLRISTYQHAHRNQLLYKWQMACTSTPYRQSHCQHWWPRHGWAVEKTLGDRLSYIHMTITFQHMRPPCIERPLPTLNADKSASAICIYHNHHHCSNSSNSAHTLP